MSLEANLSSHLTISYSAAPTASGTTAPAPGTNVASANGPASDGAAGFLAALVDQLLAGAATAPTTSPETMVGTDAAAGGTIPAPFGVAIDPATAAAAQSSPQGNVLLVRLTKELQALKDQLDSGEQPDPDLLKKLGETADALAALIAAPAPAAPAVNDPVAALDPLASIDRPTEKLKTDPLAGLVETPQQPAGRSAPSEQVTQFLASLGITLPSPAGKSDASSVGEAGSASDSTPPLPGIAQLVARLADLSQAIAPASPEIAQKLQALTQKLAGAEIDPQVLAQLTGSMDPSATAFDKVVQSLIDATPAKPASPTPQISSTAQLQIPASIAPQKPQAQALDELGTIVPVASDATSTSVAPKLAVAARPSDATQSDDSPKPEAKIIAVATAKADRKSVV